MNPCKNLYKKAGTWLIALSIVPVHALGQAESAQVNDDASVSQSECEQYRQEKQSLILDKRYVEGAREEGKSVAAGPDGSKPKWNEGKEARLEEVKKRLERCE